MAVTDAPEQTLPPPAPVGGRFGPLPGLKRNSVLYLEQLWHEHGDLVPLRLGPPGATLNLCVLSHPDAAARILSGSTWSNFVKDDPVYAEITAWLGHGLLTAQGEDWTRQKRFVQPLFTKAAVEGYAALMVDEIQQVVDAWDVSASGADGPSGLGGPSGPNGLGGRSGPGERTVDLDAEMMQLTLRVVVRALFGDSADGIVEQVRDSFPVLAETVMDRGQSPLRLPRSVPTPLVRRGRAAQRELWAACDGIIADRRAGRTAGDTDLLGRLLAARDGSTALTDDEVRDQVLIFLLAGHETTSTALTYALHLLGRHPEIQDRVRSEIASVIGDRQPTASDIAALPYTTAVLQETMRLYPSAPILGRLTRQDDEILGHRVPAGTTVLIVPRNIHRRPDLWPEPLRFDPTRFLGDRAGATRHRYAWMPFGGGPRACIGQHFSMVEATLALALILRGHRVKAVRDSDDLAVRSLITLRADEPVQSVVSRI